MKSVKGFSLLEILCVVALLAILMSVAIYNYDSLNINRYHEAKENLKTFLINNKHKAIYLQKESTLRFDSENNIYGELDDIYLLEAITNDLKILESSSTKIVFFADGSVEECYIVTTSLDGTVTNTFLINPIGSIISKDGYHGDTNMIRDIEFNVDWDKE